MKDKESKLVEFCNSPLGALLIVASIMAIGELTNHYILKNKDYIGLNSYKIEENEKIDYLKSKH